MPESFSPHWFYMNTTRQFLADAEKDDCLINHLSNAYEYHQKFFPEGKPLNKGQVYAWKYGVPAMIELLEKSDATQNQIIIIEAVLKASKKRIDCVLCGKDEKGQENVMLWELKRWNPSGFDISHSEKPHHIRVKEGEKEPEDWLHPRIQAEDYARRLSGALKHAYGERKNGLNLRSYIYFHECYKNFADYPEQWQKILFAPQFVAKPDDKIKFRAPMLTRNRQISHADCIGKAIGFGSGIEIKEKIRNVLHPSSLDLS